MPGTSTVAHFTVLAPTATIGRVLSTLVIVSLHTTWSSIAPMSPRLTATTAVTMASLYAASLLPK